MNFDKVRQVLTGATGYPASNVKLKEGETDAVAEAIFDKLKGKGKTLTIQLPYLQVFLDKFYLTLTNDNSRQAEAILDMQTLHRMGDIGDVLSNFLEDQVLRITKKLSNGFPDVSTAIVWNILSPFATLEGTKEPMGKASLYTVTGIDRALINQAIETFVDGRILRYTEETDQYEIAHDSLAKRIAEKRSDEQIALLEIQRLIKTQTSLKAGAREPFSEKQLNFIEPFFDKIQLTPEEEALIDQSREAVAKQKAAERKEREEENNRLREKQRAQKLFIRSTVLALVLVVGLAVWAILNLLESQKSTEKAILAEKAATTARLVADSALKKNERNQAVAKANEYNAFGDSYHDIGKESFACESYRAGLKELENYKNDEPLYNELKKKINSCK